MKSEQNAPQAKLAIILVCGRHNAKQLVTNYDSLGKHCPQATLNSFLAWWRGDLLSRLGSRKAADLMDSGFHIVMTGVKSEVLSGCCPNSLAFCAGAFEAHRACDLDLMYSGVLPELSRNAECMVTNSQGHYKARS